jgi:hypothetical protein
MLAIQSVRSPNNHSTRTAATCTEEFARAHGALVFNRSRP